MQLCVGQESPHGDPKRRKLATACVWQQVKLGPPPRTSCNLGDRGEESRIQLEQVAGKNHAQHIRCRPDLGRRRRKAGHPLEHETLVRNGYHRLPEQRRIGHVALLQEVIVNRIAEARCRMAQRGQLDGRKPQVGEERSPMAHAHTGIEEDVGCGLHHHPIDVVEIAGCRPIEGKRPIEKLTDGVIHFFRFGKQHHLKARAKLS